MSNYNEEEILAFIKAQSLPEDFNQWEFSLGTGWAVAHVAARLGLLPREFSKWELKDAE
jgi:hypothetical protein